MSVSIRSETDQWEEGPYMYWFRNLAPGQECFYCGEPIVDVAVHWMGKFDLFLHPDCCTNLFLRLSRDVWDVQCRSASTVT